MKKHICCIASMFMLLFNSCGTENQQSKINQPAGANPDGKMIKMFLHPLPHELEFSRKLHRVSPQEFSFETSSLSTLEMQFVADFKVRWKERFGTELASGSKGKIRIIAGIVKDNKSLQEAGKQGALNLKRLADRKNPEQAYSIATSESDGNLTVYLAANDSPGLYYALRMFEQLISADSGKQKITVPELQIMDWPDIKARGLWGGVGRKFACEDNDELAMFSGMALNEVNIALYPMVSRDRSVKLSIDNDKIERGRKYNVAVVPRVTHMEQLVRKRGVFFSAFPELLSKGKDGSAGRFWCYANPESQPLLDLFYEAIARKVESDRLCIWPTESQPENGPCFCAACKGNTRDYFINEIKHIIHAWKKAQVIRPSLKLGLISSQGTYPYNDDILKIIPKEVRIDLYAGSGPGDTYSNDIDKPLLEGYPIEKWRKEGHQIGVVPIFAPSCDGTARAMLFPFSTPALVKMRMEEFADKGLEAVIAWQPFYSFNTEAMAEFAWNAHGRSPEEFAVSWGARKGLKNPEVAGKIICMLERPSVALSINMRARTMVRCAQSLVCRMNGQNAPWSPRYDMLRGFEVLSKLDGSDRNVHDELVQTLKLCREADELCKKTDSEELNSAALLLTQWVAIIECYTSFLEHQKEPEFAAACKANISHLIAELPARWEKWIATQKPERYNDQKLLQELRPELDKVMKEFKAQADPGEKEIITE